MLDRADLLALIDAREIEAEPAIDTLEAWRAYLLGNAGGLAVAAGRLLGAPDPEALAAAGCRLWRRRRAAQRSGTRAAGTLHAA